MYGYASQLCVCRYASQVVCMDTRPNFVYGYASQLECFVWFLCEFYGILWNSMVFCVNSMNSCLFFCFVWVFLWNVDESTCFVWVFMNFVFFVWSVWIWASESRRVFGIDEFCIFFEFDEFLVFVRDFLYFEWIFCLKQKFLLVFFVLKWFFLFFLWFLWFFYDFYDFFYDFYGFYEFFYDFYDFFMIFYEFFLWILLIVEMFFCCAFLWNEFEILCQNVEFCVKMWVLGVPWNSGFFEFLAILWILRFFWIFYGYEFYGFYGFLWFYDFFMIFMIFFMILWFFYEFFYDFFMILIFFSLNVWIFVSMNFFCCCEFFCEV